MRKVGSGRRFANENSFSKFTDVQLERSFEGAVASERKCMDLVIKHIQEIEIRKLYLKKAFPSLFEYLVKVHKYSAGAAQRRIEAARLASEIPELSQKLVSGEINLTQIGEIQRSVKMAKKIHSKGVTTSMKLELMTEVCGKTTEETQRLCADRLQLPVIEHEKVQVQADGSQRIEMTFSRELSRKYELVKGLMAHCNFQAGRTVEMTDILETCFDFILARLGPEPIVEKISVVEKGSPSRSAASNSVAANKTLGSSAKAIFGAETKEPERSVQTVSIREISNPQSPFPERKMPNPCLPGKPSPQNDESSFSPET